MLRQIKSPRRSGFRKSRAPFSGATPFSSKKADIAKRAARGTAAWKFFHGPPMYARRGLGPNLEGVSSGNEERGHKTHELISVPPQSGSPSNGGQDELLVLGDRHSVTSPSASEQIRSCPCHPSLDAKRRTREKSHTLPHLSITFGSTAGKSRCPIDAPAGIIRGSAGEVALLYGLLVVLWRTPALSDLWYLYVAYRPIPVGGLE